MPRKNRQRNRKNRNPRNRGRSFINLGGQTVRAPFRVTFNLTSESSGFNSNKLDLAPFNLGDVAHNLSFNFEWFRVVKLKIRFVPGVQAVNSEAYQFAAAYSGLSGADETSGPAGMANMAQFSSFNITGGMPVNIVVPRGQLLAVANKWFRNSATDSPPVDEQVQGSIWIASQYSVSATSSLTHICLVEGEIEFRSIIEASDLITRTPVSHDESKVLAVHPRRRATLRPPLTRLPDISVVVHESDDPVEITPPDILAGVEDVVMI